jgi:LPXTG-motif cell wall-anchored protein
MAFYLTIFALLVGLGLVGLSSFIDRRRRKNFAPGLIPMLPVMFAGAIIVLLAAAHLLTLFRGYR